MSGAFPYIIRLKQGATLALDLLFQDDNGNAVNLSTASSLTMLVCDAFGDTVAAPAIVPGVEIGYCTVVADTTDWPYGTLPCQVAITAAGVTAISDTFDIVIERGVGA